MGLFKSMKNTFKQSEAAVVVQNLLERQHYNGMFNADAAKTATALVAAVWEQKPSLFDGSFGQRPHKLAVAAAALANGVFNLDDSNGNRAGVGMALGELLAEVDTNGHLYGLNSIDRELLEMALDTFEELLDEA